jgi:hypothetical protein
MPCPYGRLRGRQKEDAQALSARKSKKPGESFPGLRTKQMLDLNF